MVTWCVHVVHAAVDGRTRLRARPLRSIPGLAGRLEEALSVSPGIRGARVAARTGSILLLHDPGLSREEIHTLVLHTLSRLGPLEEVDPRRIWEDDAPAPGGRRASAHPSAPGPWHTLEFDVVLGFWEGDAERGLEPDTARHRLHRYGANRIPVPPPRTTLAIAAKQFDSVPVWLLLGSAALSAATGGVSDAVAILAVVGINAAVGTYTETLSERSIRALPSAEPGSVTVFRGGRARRIHPETLVPGDVIVLGRGDVVPADARVLAQEGASVDESALTGESMPVQKRAGALKDEHLPLGERANMVFRGTVVTGGSLRALVVGTGPDTEVGQIQRLVSATRKRATPVERQLEQLGRQLAATAGVASGAVFLVGLARGTPLLAILRSAVSLAVASIPEGLPTVATTTLSFGVRRLQKKGIYMRRLEVAEALGAMQVLCLDKTGTLTLNQMHPVCVVTGGRVYRVGAEGVTLDGEQVEAAHHPALQAVAAVCVLNAEGDDGRGEGGHGHTDGDVAEAGAAPDSGTPTEDALLALAARAGVTPASLGELARRWDVEPRSEWRMYVKTLHREASGDWLVTVKGRPDQVLELCRTIWDADGERPLTPQDREALARENERMGGDALRVLGMARGRIPADSPRDEAMAVEERNDLLWLGMVGLEDPIRPGALEMIERFREAGIRTLMITGDQSATAYAVARKLGLAGSDDLRILDSMRLATLDPQVLAGMARQVHVFSRVSPAQKLLIVDVLQRSGLVVGMTGDGVNDGPALRKADVGIALRTDHGEVAQEIADVVLSRGDLDGLLTAVAQGRTLGDDIGKAVHYIASTNLSEVLFTLLTVTAGGPVPLNPKQLLWLNILSDIFPELALSVEPPESDVLARPPRDPDLPIIHPRVQRQVLQEAGVLTATTMGAYLWSLSRHGAGDRAGTVAFMALTTSQLLHTITSRSDTHTIFQDHRLPPNRWVGWAIGSGLGLQVLAEASAVLRRFLGNTPMDLADVAVVGGAATSSFLLNETLKLTHGEPTAGVPEVRGA